VRGINVYLSYKTFEGDQIGESINAYDVIGRLLTDECFIKQSQNAWWIRRIDEMENRTTSVFRFNYLGEYQEQLTGINLRRYIAQNKGYDIIEHVGEESVKHYRRPFGSVVETFNYNLPKEIVDNSDFTRGDWLSPVPVPSKTVKDEFREKVYNGLAYTVEDWTAFQGLFPSTTPANGTANIYRYFYDGTEVERYLHLATEVDTDQWVRSNPIPIHFKDKFEFSVDARVNDAKLIILGPQTLKVFVILEGDDGVVYWLDALTAERQEAKDIVLGPSNTPIHPWRVYDGSATGLPFSVNATNSAEQGGMFLSFEVPDRYTPVPVSGNLYILLPFVNDFVDYENLKFDYKPFINGSYATYKGQQNKVGSIPGYRAVRDEEVFISDSPKKLFKGCLMKLNELGKFVTTTRWYNGAVFPGGVPSDEFLHTRGRTQAFDVWNQHNRTFLDTGKHPARTTYNNRCCKQRAS
jgi:hypothetical protein